jgi:hypothetical protein
MRTAFAFRLAMFELGVALLAFGTLHVAEKTCIHNADTVVCYIDPWVPGPLIGVGGIVLIALAVWLDRRAASKPPVSEGA